MDRQGWLSQDRTRVPFLRRWRGRHDQPPHEFFGQRQPRGLACWWSVNIWRTAGLWVLIAAGVVFTSASINAATSPTPSRSTTITISPDNRFLLVVNRETNSLSIIEARNAQGQDTGFKLIELPVGIEPRCVALHPDLHEAYVTNGVSGTVSVIDLASLRVAAEIGVGTEPRGCALTPNGTYLLVANHTEGTVGVIHTPSRAYLGPLGDTVRVGGNPMAIAITNDGDADELDETIFITQFFAELIPNGPGEARDLGKRGIVTAFPIPTLVPTRITLSPLSDSGFGASRTNFCPGTHPAHIATPILCPRPDLPATDPANANNPQGVFPNQLMSALIRGDRLFLPNVGAQPEPPEAAQVNVQALVHVVNTFVGAEVAAEHVNLNVEIDMEPAPASPTTSLAGLSGNDLVAIDATLDGTVFLIVSRGGNYVFRATHVAGSKLALGAPNVIRFQTGNLPDGVVISYDGRRAYVNNQANVSVTAINLETNTVIIRDFPSGEPPAPGTFEHAVLVGKLAFFTALGIPDNGFFDTDIRDIEPLRFRGKQSLDGWSSCGSCHPDGLGDGVTWFFGTGPRQTKPLDGMFAKDNPDDQGILNWSAVRGSNTDFNANSRATQEGCGFASVVATGGIDPPAQCTSTSTVVGQRPRDTPANPAIYDHGITQGASDALDVQTLWIFAAVRPLKQPEPSDPAAFGRGLEVFAANCASCHGGAKWTKSEIFHRDNPAVVAQNQAPFDAGVTRLPVTTGGPLANELAAFTCDGLTFNYLEDVGTFDVNNPLELRDNATASTAFGVNGFNPPSLFSVRYHAPYLHRGQAQNLPAVFPLHGLGAGASGFPPTTTIATELTLQQQQDLLVFLNALDGTTDQLRSEGDDFRDAVKAQVPPCP
jgi:YVTN family beta-propeller protein